MHSVLQERRDCVHCDISVFSFMHTSHNVSCHILNVSALTLLLVLPVRRSVSATPYSIVFFFIYFAIFVHIKQNTGVTVPVVFISHWMVRGEHLLQHLQQKECEHDPRALVLGLGAVGSGYCLEYQHVVDGITQGPRLDRR